MNFELRRIKEPSVEATNWPEQIWLAIFNAPNRQIYVGGGIIERDQLGRKIDFAVSMIASGSGSLVFSGT